MGKDKKQQLNQLLAFVKDLYDNPANKEFAEGVQAIVLDDLKLESREEWTSQINEIYELCLRRNLIEQAEDLYKTFPIPEIVSDLVDLYVKMEDARRANDFDSFGRYLFLQIELIVGTIIKDESFVKTYEGIRNLKPLSKWKDGAAERIAYTMTKSADGTKVVKNTVDEFLFISKDSVGKPLNELVGILDKCRVVLYTVCYKAVVFRYPKEDFDILSAIHNVRNHESHSGVNSTEKQDVYYEKLLVDKTINYIRFLGFLQSFINGVCDNWPLPESVISLAGK